MLKSDWSDSKVKNSGGRFRRVAVLLTALLILPFAFGQEGTSEFTLQPSPFSPDAMAPGGTSSSSISVGSVNGFSGSVDLSCQVTSTQVTTDTPVCTISPASVVPPASATATITTTTQTTTVGYSVTITGTGPTTSFTTEPLTFTVLSVTPQFTVTVESSVVPSSVVAGSGAQGVVSVNPINGYSSPAAGGVTLSCSSITPLVTVAPVCSFSYPTGQISLPINGTPATSTVTISTFGPVAKSSSAHSEKSFALWLQLPLLGLVGIGAAAGGRRSRKAWVLIGIFVVSGSMLLLPACGNNNNNPSTTPNGTTPADTYTFTIIGVDSNGIVSSNTSSGSAGPTVTLSVTAPK